MNVLRDEYEREFAALRDDCVAGSTRPGSYGSFRSSSRFTLNSAGLLNRQNNNVLGIVFMAVAFFLVAVSDAQVKLLTETLHPFQIAWTRQLGLLVGAVILLFIKGPEILQTHHLGLQILRGTLAVLTVVFLVYCFRFVPLADAIAVSLVAPFFVTTMGALFLGESVGIQRWTAISVGFIGTLIIIRPGAGAVHPAIILAVFAAMCFAARQVLTRNLAFQDGIWTTVFYTAVVSVALLSIPLPFVWTTPVTWQQIILLIGVAGFAALAEIFFVFAMEIGMAVVVAPVQYSVILWATFYGWVLFGEFPDKWTLVGITFIVGTGLYILNRERLQMRADKTGDRTQTKE
jgi:drug/metabolite transporter (DMT)-like permease